MSKKRVLVIFGGKSSEYTVSLKSASSVLAHLDRTLFEPLMLAITETGAFYHYTGSIDLIADNLYVQERAHLHPIFIDMAQQVLMVQREQQMQPLLFDVALAIVHGENTEDGALSALMTLVGQRLVGTKMLGSNLAFDKISTHAIMEANGIPMTKYLYVDGFDPYQLKGGQGVSLTRADDVASMFQMLERYLGLPFFIKPSRAGSSYGISKVRNLSEFQQGFLEAQKYDHRVLFEANITGFEVGCGVLYHQGEWILGAVDHIDLQADFFDFDNKYSLSAAQIHCPINYRAEVVAEVRQLAQKVFQVADCAGYARIDFFVGEGDRIYLNEINTYPGMTAASRFPVMFQKVGYPFTELLTLILNHGLADE